ncbi:mannan endo-1-6-alpha-mannosidase [Penicillium longicatenatum]|uniref:mannan endo-1-6-alpha-mannosidase n=1 Tax=Penicillium longicatenatum TaxID=1561947 RepID=UPI0025491E07|nr:mannan endo-1-6-alpha-mannosidase [Penicillium longicatenatum]KAJ5639748.1 mannan endo-1-6-alpha-mannosidase [Penicillium longicatenatum]
MLGNTWKTASVITLLAGAASAIDLDIKDEQSIKSAAHTAAYGAMSYYQGNLTGHIPGAFPSKWWEGSVLFDTMIHYWYLTGDDSNNPAVIQGMNWQSGDNNDYFTANYSSYMGNDEQSSWGLAVMTAAEFGFPQSSSEVSWATKAAAVFNSQVGRWDDTTCGGGLRWQIYTYQPGYGIKDAMSNGEFFELAARLARYTGNTTYSDWAEKIWSWSSSVPLLNNETWIITDSTNTEHQCGTSDKAQWSLNYSPYVTGAAFMYNLTNGDSKWKSGVDGLLNTSFTAFFPAKYGGDIMSEYECEPRELCNNNEILFKGIFMRDLALVSTVAPYTMNDILPRLQGSASAAAEACTGESNNTCGMRWYVKEYDGEKGMEQQLSAASVFAANLVAFGKNNLATQSASANATSTNPNTTETGATGTHTASSASGTLANSASVLVGGPLAISATVLAGIMALF